ncbi:hypothetical protein [Actinokineospora pegani]|uniref:hypothetical protein n=1 Tax=Actinokineospora pegani TaxID=2654637 RepID=UPI0012EA6EF4|nr:hypothetical protein [Actinokineospora pegani]
MTLPANVLFLGRGSGSELLGPLAEPDHAVRVRSIGGDLAGAWAAAREQGWDYVVLRAQHDGAAGAARVLVPAVLAAGAHAALSPADPADPRAQADLDTLGRELGATSTPVAAAWALAAREGVDLRGGAGSYLSACALLAGLFRLDPRGRADGGLPDAARLQDLAWRAACAS